MAGLKARKVTTFWHVFHNQYAILTKNLVVYFTHHALWYNFMTAYMTFPFFWQQTWLGSMFLRLSTDGNNNIKQENKPSHCS